MALARARITIEHTGEHFEVLFNPEEYSVNKDNNFAAQNIPGLGAPIVQFVNGNLRTLELELFFDTSDARQDVRTHTRKLTDLLKIDSELHAPPVVQVAWGSLAFRGVLARAQQKFVKFLEDGRPVRARVNATFNEFIDEEHEAKEVNRQTADFSKAHVVALGETLPLLAARYYEDARLWRPIALANGLDHPQELEPGLALRIPALPYDDPESGEALA